MQCIYQLISMLIKGEIWKSVDDVIGAYLIVVGIPQAVFSTYNFVRHLWWNYYITHAGAKGYGQPEMKLPMGNLQCAEYDWACWEATDRACYGDLCDDDGGFHPEWYGTDK